MREDAESFKTERARQELLRKKADLIGRRTSAGELALEHFPDAMDQVVSAVQRDVAVDLVNRNALLISQIDRALRRLAAGEYGLCTECDEPIAAKRLRAIPWAALCLSCQEKADFAAAAANGSPGEISQLMDAI